MIKKAQSFKDFVRQNLLGAILEKPTLVLTLSLLTLFVGVSAHLIFGYSGNSSGHAIGSDDAYISFRYAENLFNGKGLVYNPGEFVEGYSNLLYLLIVTPGFILSKDFIYPLSILINCVLLILIFASFWTYSKPILGQKMASIAIFSLSLSPWIWANAVSGLETILIMGIVTGSWISIDAYCQEEHTKHWNMLCLYSLLSLFSRVDGFILPLACVSYLLIKRYYKKGIYLFTLVSSIMALYTIFRLYYYNDVIANTFYNKVSGSLLMRLENGVTFYVEYGIRTGVFFSALIAFLYIFPKKSLGGLSGLRNRLNFPMFFLLLWSAYLRHCKTISYRIYLGRIS